jgi:hypothetical protein
MSKSSPGADAKSAIDSILARVNSAPASTLEAPSANGTPGNDFLTGTDGGDRINGRSGNDVIEGLDGDDRIDGGSGDDSIDGGSGDDVIRGGSGNDVIIAGEGEDNIVAGSGDDVIDGGEGDDMIRTGSGSDTVVLAGDFGNDVIADFRPGTDVLDLTAFTGITALDQLTFTEEGGNTIITAAGLTGSITVQGVGAAELRDNASVEVACYLEGTQILTPKGERPIESLAIGDEVINADGATRAIKWIGYRSFSARFLRLGSRMLPVTITAGALADNVPRRDLTVSPGHSVLIDGVLVNADLLINGETVLRRMPGPVITYVHVELETPDAIIAEGVASETYVNDGNRRQFENWADFVALHGEDHPVPRLKSGHCSHRFAHVDAAGLSALRQRITERASQVRRRGAA